MNSFSNFWNNSNHSKWLWVLIFSAVLGACNSSSNKTSNSTTPDSTAPDSFEAVLNDFVGYQNWAVQDYAVGATNPFIAGAHGAGADDISRANLYEHYCGTIHW